MITIDGGTGEVFVGAIPLVPPQLNEDFETILGWADELRRLKVRANADNPADATRAREFGAEGIGLCRTEHMFFGEERLPVVQEMILAENEGGRRAALERLLPFQQSDFEGIFEAMVGLPVTIRLLDPPLHEFLPPEDQATDETDARPHPGAARDEPDARHARLPARADVPGDLRDADPRDRPRVAAPSQERVGEAPLVEIMHPLVGFAEELRRLARAHRADLGRGGAGHRAHGRDDDRAAARLRPRRRDRRERASSSPSARTTSRRRRSASRATTPRASSSRATSRTACSSATRSRCSTRTASAT